MKTLSQVLLQALLSLEEKYHQKKTAMMSEEDAAAPSVRSSTPPADQTDSQRRVLRRFMRFRGD
jgi:hypothetical protein